MNNIKERISRQLSSIQSTKDREFLRDIMEQIFLPLCDETESKYTDLEQRIYSELPFSQEFYSVCGTVISREEGERYSWLFPLDGSDLMTPVLNAREIQSQFKNKKEAFLFRVFIEADYLRCKDIVKGILYSGILIAGDFSSSIQVRLRPARCYQEKVEQLYHSFISNGIPWATVNHPYLAKFFDVICIKMDNDVSEAPDIPCKMQIDFKNHKEIIKENIIPLWNIQRIDVISDDFPEPALDKINYEYRFLIDTNAKKDGYLLEYCNDSVSGMRREKESLIITSTIKSGLQWSMLQFHQRQPSTTETFLYPPYDNRHSDSFAGRMISYYGSHIKTKAELHRVLQFYSAVKMLTLQNFYIANEKVHGETWDVNEFIKDEIRDANALRTLVLQFKATTKGFFLNRDLMSFLTSQVQLIYPEYICVGVLID